MIKSKNTKQIRRRRRRKTVLPPFGWSVGRSVAIISERAHFLQYAIETKGRGGGYFFLHAPPKKPQFLSVIVVRQSVAVLSGPFFFLPC
jgi:hypothetical protein